MGEARREERKYEVEIKARRAGTNTQLSDVDDLTEEKITKKRKTSRNNQYLPLPPFDSSTLP